MITDIRTSTQNKEKEEYYIAWFNKDIQYHLYPYEGVFTYAEFFSNIYHIVFRDQIGQYKL